jgi:PhnB protein
MNLSFHLTFAGDCEDAFAFYERCLGGTIVTMLRYRDSPMAAQTPPEWQDKIVHATINVGTNALAGADVLPKDYARPKGFFVLLDIDDPSDAERIFHSLAENNAVQMPMQETFWATRFGVLVDRFGIPWEINCGRPVSTS